MTTRADVVAAARSWIGTPFRHQGRSRAGIDCVGLVVLVARELGLSDYDWSSYARRAHGTGFLRHFDENARPVRLDLARPGDMIVFADQLYPCHVGILASGPLGLTAVHALARRHRVLELQYDGTWAAKARLAYGFPGLEDG